MIPTIRKNTNISARTSTSKSIAGLANERGRSDEGTEDENEANEETNVNSASEDKNGCVSPKENDGYCSSPEFQQEEVHQVAAEVENAQDNENAAKSVHVSENGVERMDRTECNGEDNPDKEDVDVFALIL